MKTSSPVYLKMCATCKHWGGERRPNAPSLTIVEYDSYGQGTCYQTNLPTPCNQGCSKWEQQFKK